MDTVFIMDNGMSNVIMEDFILRSEKIIQVIQEGNLTGDQVRNICRIIHITLS